MEWMLLGAGLTIGGGAGAIFGGLLAGSKVEYWREHWNLERMVSKEYQRECRELRAWKASVLSGLNKASAARKSKRLEKQAQERLIKQARHAEMRAKFGTAELV